MRPANIITSIADVLAGIAVSGYLANENFSQNYVSPILLLIISTIGLYGGGVVFNDLFDAELDKIERPERPIPKGIISIKEASFLGIILLVAGIIAAALVSVLSGLLALSIAVASLIYDKWSKHNAFTGPLNMGLCRGLNLLLGISIIVSSVASWWFLAIVPVIYIAAITMVSRGEVNGGSKNILYIGCILILYSYRWHSVFIMRMEMIWWTHSVFIPFFVDDFFCFNKSDSTTISKKYWESSKSRSYCFDINECFVGCGIWCHQSCFLNLTFATGFFMAGKNFCSYITELF